MEDETINGIIVEVSTGSPIRIVRETLGHTNLNDIITTFGAAAISTEPPIQQLGKT